MWPGSRPIFAPTGILIHPAAWPQQTWAEDWGLCPPPFFKGGELCSHFFEGAGSPSSTLWPGSRHTSVPSGVHLYSRLATIDIGRKLGGVPLFREGEQDHHLAQHGRKLEVWLAYVEQRRCRSQVAKRVEICWG